MASAQEFTEVYQEALPLVWYFVSSRIPDNNDAQDVTSEVFIRAWQSWSRYDPSRGTIAAWLCGIAQRTIADWWRKLPPRSVQWEKLDPDSRQVNPLEGLLTDGINPEPDRAVLEEEFIAELRSALHELSERERDALALRFGAGLRVAEIAEILDLSVGAAKMMVWRAIMKLKAAIAPDMSIVATEERIAEVLDDAIEGVLARRREAMPDPLLRRLVQYLAIVHQPSLPAELPDRVRECLSCFVQEAKITKGDATMHTPLRRLSWVSFPSLLQGIMVPCGGVCAAYPIFGAPLAAAGLFAVAWVLHFGLYVVGPVNLLLLWLNFRRHRDRRGLLLAAIGVPLILLAVTGHFISFPRYIHDPLIWVGFALLGAGVFLDWLARCRLLSRVPIAA